jgi:hypothetical protein
LGVEVSGPSESRVLINTVEKAELMSAIGREIERIDRVAASKGYTNWALWAAMGVLGWKFLEAIEKGVTSTLPRFFLFLAILLLTFRMLVRTLFGEKKPLGSSYFRTAEMGRAEQLRIAIWVVGSAACLAIAINEGGRFGVREWPLAIFLGVPALAAIGASMTNPLFPVADGKTGGKRNRIRLWFSWVWIALGLVSLSQVHRLVDWSEVIRPDASAKAALLLVVLVVLLVRLTHNAQFDERRSVFQRLETEMTLSKIGFEDARDRYENLMLGLSVSAAVRPWVDATMIPLDKAGAVVADLKQLLSKLEEAQAAGDGQAITVAIEQRASILLQNAEKSLADSRKGYLRLGAVTHSMFGKKDPKASPISAEAERISESSSKLQHSITELRSRFNLGES